MEEIQMLLLANARAVVDKPEEASVSIAQGEQTTVYQLRVNKSDLGKIIGKKGSMAQAFRTILNAVSTKNKIRAVLEIME